MSVRSSLAGSQSMTAEPSTSVATKASCIPLKSLSRPGFVIRMGPTFTPASGLPRCSTAFSLRGGRAPSSVRVSRSGSARGGSAEPRARSDWA